MISPLTFSGSHTAANLPRCCAAALRTIGVSSAQSLEYVILSCDRVSASLAGHPSYATATMPHADMRAVNQSPDASLCTAGTKCAVMPSDVIAAPTLHADSTAFSLTTVSSTVERFSRGARRQWTCSGPPTLEMRLPISSAIASRHSSSSSLLSVRNGTSSDLVRSAPSADAIVVRRLMLFRRSWTFSFWGSGANG